MEISFGGYAMPLVLSLIMTFIYKLIPTIPDKWKAAISVGSGLILGNIGIAYRGLEWTVQNLVDFNIYGFMVGLSGVGLYELQRTVTKPRE